MGSILWVIQKGSILWVIFSKQKRSNSLSHIFQKKNLFVIIFEKKKLQVCDASHQKKKGPILCIKIQKHKFQVSASGTILWVMRKINSLRIFSKKKINSLNQMKTWVTCKKKRCSIRWVVLKKEVRFFDFESYISDKNSILWIILKKRFNSLSHIFRNKVQFFESFWEKGSILWIIFRKRVNSLRQI